MDKHCIILDLFSAPKLTMPGCRMSAFRQVSNLRGDDLADRLTDDATKTA